MKKTFFFLILLCCMITSTGMNSFENPDFSFPADVIASADSVMTSRKASDLDRTCAVMQFSYASLMRDPDSISVVLQRINDILTQISKHDARALLLMYKAATLRAVYNNLGYKINSNIAPTETLPDNLELWTEQQFDEQIKLLVTDAIKEMEHLQKSPLSRYKNILKWYPKDKIDEDNQLKYSPYLRDFIFHFAINCIINDNGERERVISEMCRRAKPGTMEWVEWNSLRDDYDPLLLYNQFPKGNIGAALLIDADKHLDASWNENINQRRLNLISLIEKHLTDNSVSTDFADALKAVLKNLKRANVYLKLDSNTFYPGAEIKMTLESHFCQKVGIAIYKDLDSNKKIDNQTPIIIKEVETSDSGIAQLDTITIKLDQYGYYDIRLMCNGKFLSQNTSEIKIVPYIPIMVRTDNAFSITLFNSTTGECAQDVEVGRISDGKFRSLGRTNSDGIIIWNRSDYYLNENTKLATRDSLGCFTYPSSYYNMAPTYSKEYSVHFFTPRNIYHRGDTVQWSLLAYYPYDHKVEPNHKINVQFYDANGDIFETQSVITDQYGRASGTIVLPDDRLAGTYRISPFGKSKFSGCSFEVSDFKIANFEIVDLDANLNTDNHYIITGRCRTFSGASVALAQVSVSASYNYWYRQERDNSILAQTTTADDGSFTLDIPADTFNDYDKATLKFVAATQSNDVADASLSLKLNHRAFIIYNEDVLRNYYNIVNVNIDEPFTLNGFVVNPAGNPIEADLNWRIMANDSTQVASGSFKSNLQGSTTLDFSNIPAGQYALIINPADSTLAEPSDRTILLYSIGQNIVPNNVSFITPIYDVETDASGLAQIIIGTPRQHAAVLMAAADNSNGFFLSKQIQLNPGFNSFDIQLPQGAMRAYCTIAFIDGLESCVTKYTIIRPDDNQFTIDIESWRDKAASGQPCKWRINLSHSDGTPVDAALVASIYNHALDFFGAGQPQYLYPEELISHKDIMTYRPFVFSHSTGTFIQEELIRIDTSFYHDINLLRYIYCQDIHSFFYQTGVAYGFAQRNNATMASAPMLLNDCVIQEEACAVEEVAEQKEMSDSSEQPNQPEGDFSFRQGDVLQALWLPDLTTNADGSVTIYFSLPNANGQWAFVLSAWTADLHTNGLRRIITTSKPLMVQPSLPCFLRHGDHATLCATVYNSTDHPLSANAVIEVYNPENDSIIASSSQILNINADGSTLIAVDASMTPDLHSIGVRVKASSDHFSDGEINLLPVLEASSTVIESTTFYLNSQRPVFEMTLPENLGENTTLQYCQNPIWEAVKALPELYTADIITSPGAANALFGATISQGIASQHPEVVDGINQWMAQPDKDPLRSALYKNEQLKLATLQQTPWMATAASQTQRMQRIALSLDADQAKSVFEKAISRLAYLQNPDGGFRWIDGFRESSRWTTSIVLKNLGLANACGLLPNNNQLNKIIDHAFNYIDNNAKDFKIEYALIYSLFPERKPSTLDGQQAIGEAIEYILSNKEDLTTASRAVAALVLEANNRHASALEMIRSLRQFQIQSPMAGISYPSVDNIDSYAHILMAFAKIDPRQDELDAMRQWLVLRAQVTDDLGAWDPSYLIYAILGSGSKWTTFADNTSVISINDHTIIPDSFEQITGNLVYQILPEDSGASIRIERPADSSVSYGGITTITCRPINQVKAHALPELSIDKHIFAQRNGQWIETTDLFAGEQIRIDLTISSARDLEYVIIDDQRAANLQPLPSEQLPCTRWESGTIFYREHNDQNTRLYFAYLPKGAYHFQYNMTVTSSGSFSSGFATIQSQLAPAITAHSSALQLSAK